MADKPTADEPLDRAAKPAEKITEKLAERPERVAILVQARSGSSRLPGKCFLPLPAPDGPTILDWVHTRLSRTGLPVCFLVPEGDEQLRDFCAKRGWQVFTGPEDDVRERYRSAARSLGLDAIIRATGDNPFVDPENVGLCLERFVALDCDLFSLSGLPLGLGVEIFRVRALFKDAEPTEPAHMEHVSLHIKHFPELFSVVHEEDPRLASLDPNFSARLSGLRLTLDERRDYETLCLVAGALAADPLSEGMMGAGLEDFIRLLQQRPELFRGNCDVEQRRFFRKQ